MIKNAKIKFENWGSNAKVEAIKFVYADNSELAKAVRYMSRKENIAAILDSELSHHAVTTSARETSFTTTPQTTTTTTTTTTAKPIAASENGKNVGLDETSAAGCDITFSESLFNESGVCYFTITPKAGYTLSDGYTVKVGTEVLSPKNNYNPKIEQWFFWIIVDAVCFYLYIVKGIPFKAGLYGLYVIIAVAGYFKWKKMMIKKS